ncbi:MAG: tRNA pseudouridine synthase A [Myxococcaceae bacterium]
MSARQRLAMWVWYRGDLFRGFQRQTQGPTVQESLLEALRPEGVRALMPSSRTDLGVHARMQVVSFKADSGHAPDVILEATRARLPPGLGLTAVVAPSPSFHAQFSCVAREYRYRLSLKASPFAWSVRTHPRITREPELDLLQKLLVRYVGTHDFGAFHEKSSTRKPRTLHSVSLHSREDDEVELRFRGSGFGRYQVRYLVGSAVAVAAGALKQAAWEQALETGAKLDGVKAPAEGLVLWNVEYPAALDPFPKALRAGAPTVPNAPPFR